MASLDLGTLIAKIKVEGAATAQSALRGVSSALGQTTTNTTGAASGMGSFTNAVSGALGNINICGTNLGTLATAFGGSEVASIAMGTALGGVVTAGIMAGVAAVKALTSACVDFVKSSVDIGISFQAQMSKVSAISGATDEDLKTLTSTAKQLGKDTVFSSTEVAQAMEYTALAGWKTEEAVKGLPAILNLAAASSMDLGKASDIVTDYLTAFGLEVEDSTRLVDVMAYAMGNTNTNTEQLGEAYKMTAGTCDTMGVSLEEATAWLGLMANAGYKGEQAGSALNAVLGRLYGETKTTNDAMAEYGLTMYDNEGKAKNFTSVMGEIETAMSGMTDQQQNVFLKAVAGTNQMSKFAVMLNATSDEAAKLTTELENAGGTSEKMMNTMNDNISGIQKSIGSKVESIKLSIFTAIEPLIEGVLIQVESFTGHLASVLEPVGNIIGTILGYAVPIVKMLTSIGDAVFNLAMAFLKPFFDDTQEDSEELLNTITTVCNGIGTAIEWLSDIITPVMTVLGNSIMGVINFLTGNWSQAAKNFEASGSVIVDSFKKMTGQTDKYNDSVKSMEKATKDTAKNVSKSWDDLSDDVDEKVSHITSTMKKVSSGGTYTSWSSGVSQNFNVKGAYENGTDYVPSTGKYLVGERGPEIVTLSQGASVTPNHEIGGTTNTYHITIDASNVREFNDVIDMVNGYTQNSRMGGGR